MRADYILSYKDQGLTAATRADTKLRESVSSTARTVARAGDTVDRMTARQASAWRRAAAIASESQRRVTEGQIQSSRKVDASISRTVASLRKQGRSYEEVVRYMQRYRVDAEQTARAVQRSAEKEVAATDRVLAAQKRLGAYGDRLKRSVGFGSASALHPLSSVRSGLSSAGSRARGALSGGAGLLAGGLLGFVSVSALKGAAEGTTQLLQNAQALQKFSGLSMQTAASWVAVANAYGVSTTKLGMTFRTLGTLVQTQLTKPTSTSARVFKDLGITTDDLRAHQHDLSAVLGIVADHLNKLPPGANKTADASKLLGRSWQTLVPLLATGSKGMQDQLDQAKALGVQLGGNSTQNVAKLHEAMINLKLAQTGMSVQFTEHILPALLSFMNFGIRVYSFLRRQFGPVFHFLGGAIHSASQFLKTHTALLGVLKTVVVGAVAAFAGFKVISLTTRLFRGLASDVRAGYDAFKLLARPVELVKSLFGKSTSAEEQLMAANAKLAESNARLAASYEEVATAAGTAAERQAISAETGGAGALPMAGGAVRTAETGAREAAALTPAVAQYGEAGLIGGAAGGRALVQAEAQAAKTGVLARVGGGLLRGGMIAGGGLMATQLLVPVIASATGMSRHSQSVLSGIGTGASIGAGLGSIVPGVGTVLGGLGGGAIGGILSALHGPDLFGQWQNTTAFKQTLAKGGGFGAALMAGQKQMVEQAAAQKTLADVQKQINTASVSTLSHLQTRLDAAKREGVLTRRQAGAAQTLLDARGAQILQGRLGGTMGDIATSKFAPSAAAIFQRTTQDLGGLSAHLQDLGATAMVKFDAGLEAKGKLARGTTDRLIKDLEKRYGPGLTAMLGSAGANSMQAFVDSVKTSNLVGTVQDQVDAMHKKWSLAVPQAKVTSDNLVSVVSGDMDRLRGIIATSTGKQHDEAVAAYNALRKDSIKTLGSMVTTLGAQQRGLRDSIAHNSASARDVASTNFFKMAQRIAGAVGSGVEATGKGIVQISKALNSTLTAFGGAKLPGVLAVGNAVVKSASAVQSVINSIPGGATGGRVPGPVGPDNWTLVDPRGRPAARVGGGEILVANRHTERRVDQMLAPYGTSLGHEVAGESRAHSLTYGGRVAYRAFGGYVDPIPGIPLGRTDQGVDASPRPGTLIGALGTSTMTALIPNWYSGQPLMNFQLRNGPDRGRYWYVAEQIVPLAHVGQTIPQGRAVAVVANRGTGIEMGFSADAAGTTLARATSGYTEGQVTPAGLAFRALITGGKQVGIMGGAPSITAPRISGKGTIPDIVRLATRKMAAAANAMIARRAGGGAFTGTLSGPVEKQVYEFMSAVGFNKIAVAGMLGNAMQESSMNPNAPGGGLWQQISNFGSGSGGSLLNQMRTMLPQIQGLKAAMNAAGSPGAAATIFMQGFERPGIPALANRISAANAAYAAGYQRGGRVPEFAGAFGAGGAVTADRPTLALFGDRGRETAMFLPHAQAGARITASAATAAPKTTTAFNPLTGQIETHTAAEWQVIHAEIAKTHAQQSAASKAAAAARKAAATARAAHNKWLAQTVTDTVGVRGLSLGTFQITRRLAQQEHLPMGGRVNLFGDLGKIAQAGFAKLLAAIRAKLALDSPEQQIRATTTFVRRMQSRGPVGAMYEHVHSLTAELDRVRDSAERLRKSHEALAQHAWQETGEGRRRDMARLRRYREQERDYRARENKIDKMIDRLDRRITGSRAVQIANQLIATSLASVTSALSSQQAAFSHDQTIATLIEGLPAGSTARSLHLSPMMLHAAGLNRRRLRRLAGAGSGSHAALAEQITYLTRQELPQLEQDAKRLQKLYRDALRTHNKKLQQSLLKELDTVSQALLQAQTDRATARAAMVTNSAALVATRTSGREGTLTAAQGLAATPGEEHAARILARTVGIHGHIAAAGTAAASAQTAQVARRSVEALGAELVKLNRKLARTSDEGMQKTIKAAIASTGAALATAASNLKTAIEGAAQTAVDMATHASTMATTGEQHLNLLQELHNTAGTPLGATQMAAFIRTHVLPALGGELRALEAQRRTALKEGDKTLAQQIAEAIAGKQNDILQAQLDAQNAIKAATQATEQELSQLSGATGFDYGGQQFTDAIAANVGA